jgi:hypothetical protein
MQEARWDIGLTAPDDHDDDFSEPGSAEDTVDRFGFRAALIVLCAALLIAAMSAVGIRSFATCSALDDAAARHACYDALRAELLKPPAKGGDLAATPIHR